MGKVKKIEFLILLAIILIMPITISLVKATNWIEIKRFYYNADRLEETTENFTCDHVSWRINYKYHPWYGWSSFNITVYKIGVNEPIDIIYDFQDHYILTKTGERYYDNNGTFFLKITAVNIAYYYEIIIEQDIDSIPEFTPFTLVAILIIVSVLVVALSKKKVKKKLREIK